ncbi:hypothetical protein [Paenibacillus naphthalenovorans]|uniref:Uncharacterized protein n=1 Tax=Paenibacillus naphthalenovorans TaxID=162209 RepID=A0A0U2MWV3_9BACL|nr:hypothetical protein [Paenibacillus naphthalenovorans]ALS22463.1 hypothetical protein IJ22_20890 [Paenibacillus naphthalenovorans]
MNKTNREVGELRSRNRLWKEQSGAVSIYLIAVLVPIFLLCGLLIDVMRWKSADKEAENAVKAGVRSTLSAYSKSLQTYGLYSLHSGGDGANRIFERTVAGNVSEAAEPDRFRFIDQRYEAGSARITPMYALSNHGIFKQQILEEMKYRAPMIYGLELADKFKKTGVAARLGQASRFGEHAARVEKLLEERDLRLDEAWEAFLDIRQKATEMHPFYQTHLRDLNELSGRIGIHTIENVRSTLQNAKAQVETIQEQIRSLNASIAAMVSAGAVTAEALAQLNQARVNLERQLDEAVQKVMEYEQLLQDLIRYAEVLAMLKLKSTADMKALSSLHEAYGQAMSLAKKANDELNAEISRLASSQAEDSGALEAEKVFGHVHLVDRQDLDEQEAGVSASVSKFYGVHAQIQDGLMFTQQKYAATMSSLDGFRQKADEVFSRYNPGHEERQRISGANRTAKREQRSKTQAVLDQIQRGLGSCSLISGTDPYEGYYKELQGNPAERARSGYVQSYLEWNQAANAAAPVPDVNLRTPDEAGLSALRLVTELEQALMEIRDDFYINEFAVSKFSYRTLGLEKDAFGQIKASKELSAPQQHPLTNQEVEYLLYGAGSCAGNYSMAYAEMFAFRLAVGVLESLLEPQSKVLTAGSPLLVLLAAIAEGALQAQQDMARLIQGEQLPVSSKLGNLLTMGYKDYLRVFLLLHSREETLLSRMQGLLQLNTGLDLREASTYVTGTASTSFQLWFLPRVMKALGKSEFSGCVIEGNRCRITKTADYTY